MDSKTGRVIAKSTGCPTGEKRKAMEDDENTEEYFEDPQEEEGVWESDVLGSLGRTESLLKLILEALLSLKTPSSSSSTPRAGSLVMGQPQGGGCSRD